MKITRIETKNFIGARAVDVSLTRPVNIFSGSNYAGKSSLQEAIRMALTGESVRVGLKKDYAKLITEGADSGFASVIVEGKESAITLPNGSMQGNVPHPALPYVLDAQRFAKLDPNERRAFLFGLMGLSAGGAEVKKRLIAKGCNETKVDAVIPLLRAGFYAACKEAQTRSRESKAQWKTITGGETYGSQKATTWKAQKPTVDPDGLDQAMADLAKIEGEIEAGTKRLGELHGLAQKAAEQDGKLAELRGKAEKYARIQDKLNRDESELIEWEKKVSETERKAGCGKKTGLVHDLAYALIEMIDEPQPLGIDRPAYLAANEAIESYTFEYGEIVSGGESDPEAAIKLPEYQASLKLTQNAVANGKRDLAIADAAAQALKSLEDETPEAVRDDEINALKSRIDALKHGRGNQKSAIKMLEESARRAAEADDKTKRAADLHADVQQWEEIADALSPSGIPGEMLAEALTPLNERLKYSSGISEWADVSVAQDMQVLANDRPYALLSESEKWRADAMIAEAVSHLSGLKLLVLDRFDVLDLAGRSDLIAWLEALAQDNEIDTALIFGTLKAMPSNIPETIAAHWIENGVCGQSLKS